MRGISPSRIEIGAVLETGRELALRDPVAVPDFDGYTFPEPALVDVRIRRVGRGAEVAGSIDATARGTCVRCLEDAAVHLELDLLERLEPGDSVTRDPLDDSNVLEGTSLDLGDLVRQLIDSALPLALTCDASCAGLCDQCGRRRPSPEHPDPNVCRCPPSVEET